MELGYSKNKCNLDDEVHAGTCTSLSTTYPGFGLGDQGSAPLQASLHPIHFDQIDRVLPKVFPGQPKDSVPQVYSGSTLRPATGWARLKRLLRKPPEMVSLDMEERRLQLRKIV